MGFPIRKFASTATTGTLDTLVAGTQTSGGTVNMSQVQWGSLCARIIVDVETNTLTLYGDWQVSDDASTWSDVAPMNNAANVVIGTGTGGADASITKVLEAPQCVYSFRYARLALRNGVVTGNAADTYSVVYHYLKPSMV